uniref:Uncharacterized protein n=1 Tax=Brassica oleracea TaxID=3712 RepID=A0A3P6BNB0_BRAOL|nr:unnamed protein product [Brassica oleracea]
MTSQILRKDDPIITIRFRSRNEVVGESRTEPASKSDGRIRPLASKYPLSPSSWDQRSSPPTHDPSGHTHPLGDQTARQRPVPASNPRPPAFQRPSPAADLPRCTSASCLAQLCGPPASISGDQARPSIDQWSGLPSGRPIRPIQLMYV